MKLEALRQLFRRSERRGPVDPVLLGLFFALLGLGLVLVYSSSLVEALTRHRDAEYFLKRQGMYALGAIAVALFIARVDYHKLRPLTYPFLGSVVVLMVLLVVGLGRAGGGAERWLRLGPINIQPSELAKLSLILWLAYSLEKKRESMRSFGIGVLPHLIIAGTLMLLCLKQPDFGSAVVLLVLTFSLLFVAGARVLWLSMLSMVGAGAGLWLVRTKAYRWERILAWFDMVKHRQDLAYQPYQAAMSFGSGEVTGHGIGGSLQVLYLPEAHTDFISAVLGEELGFVGILLLALLFLAVVYRGMHIALTADSDYGRNIAFGISLLFGLQSVLNLGVAMSVLPTKGLTLPFISYGGSSLLVSAAAMGILLNISRGAAPRRATGKDPEASASLLTQVDYGEVADGRRSGASWAREGVS